MVRATEHKIVLVTQQTRLQELVRRYNTVEQARFYIEHHGGEFDDYAREHATYQAALQRAAAFLESYGRLQTVDRAYMPNYLFGTNDLVIALGRDGLVANVLKYLSTQKLVGVNPDPRRWDGVLVPFAAAELPRIVPELYAGKRPVRDVTLAQASLNDGQRLLGVNDLFIGRRTHASARYEISIQGASEAQSSSGIIVSTGLGSTGWLKSVIAGASGIDRACGVRGVPEIRRFDWHAEYLYFTVREPFPSASTGAELVFGKIAGSERLRVVSFMPEDGVIFSDGMEQDFLQFNSGAIAEIGIAEQKGQLVA